MFDWIQTLNVFQRSRFVLNCKFKKMMFTLRNIVVFFFCERQIVYYNFCSFLFCFFNFRYIFWISSKRLVSNFSGVEVCIRTISSAIKLRITVFILHNGY